MSALDEDEKKLLALLKKKADSGKTASSKDAHKSHQKHAAKPAVTKVIQSGGPTGVPPGASYSTAAGGKLADDPLLELAWDPKKDTHYRQWKSKMDMVDEATHALTKSFNDLKMVGDIAAINKIVRKALTKKQNLAIPTSTSGRADFDRLKLRLEDILKVQLGDDAVVALREFAGPLRKYFDGLSVNSTLQAGAEQIYTHGQLVAHCKHRWAKARLRKVRTQFSEAEKSLREKLAKDLLNLRNRYEPMMRTIYNDVPSVKPKVETWESFLTEPEDTPAYDLSTPSTPAPQREESFADFLRDTSTVDEKTPASTAQASAPKPSGEAAAAASSS